MKYSTYYSYLIAYQQEKYGDVLLTTTDEYKREDKINPIILKSNKTPEKLYIKNETYQKLSDEAKEIISTILSSPLEMLELFSPKENKTNFNKILIYFKKQLGRRKAKLAIKEIITFVNEL